ncbi:MAG: hypothetical protein WCS37_21180, partial [Chloroflexota bacterium]
AVEGLGLGVAVLLLPMVMVERGVQRIGQRSKIAKIRHEYEHSRRQIEVAARMPADFLAIYLKRLQHLRANFLKTKWTSQEEAELGYALLKQAEAALLIEAQRAIGRLPGQLKP